MSTYISLVAMVLGLFTFTGCVTTDNQSQINAAAVVIQQAAYMGAEYAIQQNTNNVVWFSLADSAIKTFATGKDLSPSTFESDLNAISPNLKNQWIQLAIDSTIVVYDGFYSQYVISQVNSNAVAVTFLDAITTGFDEALGTSNNTNTVSMLRIAKPYVGRPSIIKH